MKKIEIIETLNNIDKEVEIFGWVNSLRKHGKIIFIDLRDRSGILQCLVDSSSKYFDIANDLKPEYVVRIKGIIKRREPKLINKNIETGEIELLVKELEILNSAETLPIPIDKDGYEINEELRLKYRYIDLKRKRLQKNLIKRNEAIFFIRNWLNKRGFVEIETPILSKSTPEGARDYLVPSRIYKGKFYALPQSPQQYKQLLMISGFEKYFQIARCFRDEDPRGDRQPEFTQLDLEMSFIDRDDILNLIEELIIDLVKNVFPEKKIENIPFPKIKYESAIEKYGSDKPDLRKEKDKDNLSFAFIIDFPMFEWKESENRWDAVHHPFTQPKTKDGEKDFEILIKYLKEKPEELLSEQYDLVLNGFEIGGGSLRIYNPELLIKVFETMGNKREDVIKKFNHLLTAFKYGVPPHGGIALGLDRLLAILLNEESIREVIAFPKTGEGRDPMMDIPSEVEKEQLDELGIKFEDEKDK
ncbi:MAG: aspartate--tRNA ligase [Minisyncoccia bacterium]